MQQVLEKQRDAGIRVFVIWEPVLLTDWAAPSTASLARVPDSRVQQYWDRGGLWLSNGFAFCFVAGRTASPIAKRSTDKLWPVVTNSPSRAHVWNFSGKLAPALAKSLRLPLDAPPQM